jgi:hypothetical protein
MGSTITEALTSDWYPQRFPYQPQPWDCAALSTGAPLPGYDAPGQHIEDAAGNFWPKARYIQYRVNFFTRESDKTPVLHDVTIYYDNAAPDGNGGDPKTERVYLPLILR